MSEPPDPISRLRPLLGTFVAIEIPGDCPLPTETLEAAFGAIGRVETLMHPQRDGSDVARINAASVGQAIAVDAWTLEVLELAQRLNRESGGAFDPCLPLGQGRMRDISLLDSCVTLRRRVALDLGGIAKGYAVDRAVEELRQRGASSGLVNAGGDLRVFGAAARTIQARRPDGGAVDIPLRDGAIAVSAPRAGASPPEHRGHYHGDTGTPVDGRGVVVVAPTAAEADALCKCALLCEPALLGPLLQAHAAQLILP